MLRANAGAVNYHLEIGQSTLSIPYIATGADELVIPALNVSLSDNFSIPLLTSGTSTIDLGALQLIGRVLFERQAGVFRCDTNCDLGISWCCQILLHPIACDAGLHLTLMHERTAAFRVGPG